MLLDLEFGRCRLVLAAREESGVRALDQVEGVPRVATCFPKLTKKFFNDAKRQVEIVPVSGAAEIAPRLGIAELVVDLTSTGSTLRVNGLVEIATLLESSARLISRSGNHLRRELRELVDALASVLRARGRRYLMANVPRQSLDEVRKVLPGLNGPTVVDVLDGGRFVAVHAVVDSNSIYRTIAALKSLGAEGILVTKIERLMP
jgi:ATP phosphoribosyltransferase